MANEPRVFLGDPQLAGNLVTRHTLFGTGHQVNRHQPLANLDFGLLEYRTDADRELLAARLALLEAGATGALAVRLGSEGVPFTTAMRAHRFAVRPPLGLQERTGLVLVVQDRGHRGQVEIGVGSGRRLLLAGVRLVAIFGILGLVDRRHGVAPFSFLPQFYQSRLGLSSISFPDWLLQERLGANAASAAQGQADHTAHEQ